MEVSLTAMTEIEKAIGVTPIETVSIHPLKPLYEACRKMVTSRARRIPIVDMDDETGRAMVVSVITQYRILKFVAVNVQETQWLRKPLKELNVGTFTNLATAHMDTPVMDVIHMLVKKSISSVPIIDNDGMFTINFQGCLFLLTHQRCSHQCFRSSRCTPVDQRRSLRRFEHDGR